MKKGSGKGGRRARHGTRRQGREMALQMLYQWEIGRSHENEVFRSFDLYQYAAETLAPVGETAVEKGSEAAFDYARTLVSGTLSRIEEIDAEIVEQAENWRIERMPLVDRNVLRLAVFQLLAERDVPAVVVIDEAIELAKKFGSERSGAFVNGLLDGMVERLGGGDPTVPAASTGAGG